MAVSYNKFWKLFREKLSCWKENYMEGLVKEYANFLNDDKKPASEKFWELEKRIKDDKRHPGLWGKHCLTVAHCAENIANACGNMDAEKAYILKHINYTKQK